VRVRSIITVAVVALITVVTLGLGVFLPWPQQPEAPPSLSWADLAPPPGTAMREWQWVVMHHSASRHGSAADIHAGHVGRGWEGLGYHFVIGNGNGMPLGRIEWSFRWHLQRHGAHSGNREHNDNGIGICLVGDFSAAPPDPAQWDRAVDLVATLIESRPGLAVERVIGHRDVPGRVTACPGKWFDLDAFRQAVRRRIAERQGVTPLVP
jgi:hypothetical protein